MITGEHAVPRISIGARGPLSVIQKRATTVSHRRREWVSEEPGGLYRASGVDSRRAMDQEPSAVSGVHARSPKESMVFLFSSLAKARGRARQGASRTTRRARRMAYDGL